MSSTLSVVPPPDTIDLASDDVVVDVDLEKDDDQYPVHDDTIELEEEDGISFPELVAAEDSNSGGVRKTWLMTTAVVVLVAVVIIGAVVGTKDQRAAKKASASSSSDTGIDAFTCTPTALMCPALPTSDASKTTVKAFLVGDPIRGENSEDLFGKAVSVNCDGSIIAVGTSEYDDRSGYVKVYQWVDAGASRLNATPEERNTKSTWVQLGQTLKPSVDSPDRFGYSVSLSQNGMRLAVGGRFSDTTLANGTVVENVGSAFVFELENDTWQPVGQVIFGEAEDDQSGRSVELDWSGSRLVIGASGNDGTADKAGHARVFEWTGTSWTKLGNDIDGEAADDHSGSAVAMSADGSVVAVGAHKNDATGNQDSGHVRLFAYSDHFSYWNQMGQDIDGEDDGDWTGLSLALSANGKRLVVGAPGNNERFWPGVSKVYDFINSTWVQVGDDLEGGGYSVDITNDGNRVALGSYRGFENGPNSGQVLIYEFNEGSATKWTPVLGQDSLISGEAGSMFGTQVALSSDGMRVVASSPATSGNDTDSSPTFVGSVNVFDLCQTIA